MAPGMNSDRSAPPASLPSSDISPWVGLVGVVTLFIWIMICRHWPDVVTMLGLPGPHERLSGPYAALLSIGLLGLTMSAWSVLVEKVHRRPSTGIDWHNPRSLADVRRTAMTKLVGLWGTWAIIAVIYCLGRWYWDGQYLFAMHVLTWAIVPMVVLSVPYVLWLERRLVNTRDHAWHFGAFLLGQDGWDAAALRKHGRAWAIKGFFGAFMISILPPGFASVVNADFSGLLDHPVELGSTLFELLFVIDVQIGTVGYLLTFRPLDSHIRSGNPFLAGWVAALLCYPPVVYAFMGNGGIIQYEVNTPGWGYWLDGQTTLLWIWAGMLVFLTAVYAWATVAYGIRFSNLTYRGVVTNGPYRFTRHPAYLSKNAFWWLSVLPFLVTSGSLVDMVRNTVFLGAVSAIYYWRARTEEAHLLAEDEKYRAYHAWMEHHGPITVAIKRLLGTARRRPAQDAQPPA